MAQLSTYAMLIKSLREHGSPPVPRFAAHLRNKRQRHFLISDDAYTRLQELAYLNGLRRQDHFTGAQTGNISLLLELIGDRVYTLTPTPLEEL